MKESIHKYFQVGTIQWMSYPKSAPMDSLLEIARDDYFDAIELKGYGADNEKGKVDFGAKPSEGLLWRTAAAAWPKAQPECN